MTTDNTQTDLCRLRYDAFQVSLNNCTEAERDKLEWLWGYLHGALGKSKSRLTAALGVAWEPIADAFTGRLQGNARADLFDAIDALKRRAARNKPLVRTVITDRIIEALDYARDYSAMIYVSGPTGRGKTYTAEWWANENNHGRSKYLRIPSECSRRALVRLMCQVCGVACRGNTTEMEENLHRALSPRNILIIDEAGHLLSKSGRPGGAIEFLRDLHDTTKCGVGLIFTDVYLKEIKSGYAADYFEQFLGRLEFPVEIPKLPRRDEVRSVLQAYFDDPAEDLVNYALAATRERDGKLRTLFKDLARAEEYAAAEGRKPTKADLQLMVQWRKSGGAWPDDR